jgi:uncharacterized protein YjiS (DUF1127 family)
LLLTNSGRETGCLGSRIGPKSLHSEAEMEMKMSVQYPVVPLAAGALARVLAEVLSPLVRSFQAVKCAMRHRREANVLARLDRRMLADIGLTRSDVRDAFSTPLWEDPTALLRERAIERRMGRKAGRANRLTVIEPGFHQPATGRPARQAV